MEELTRIERFLNRLKALEDVRAPVLDVCREVTQYVIPRRGKYLSMGQTAEQEKRSKYSKIIKNTAGRAHRVLKAGMQTGLTPPSGLWFNLAIADQDLIEWGPVRLWLDQTTRDLMNILSNSNFYSATHALYGEQAGFGTACMLIEEDPEEVIRCRLQTMGEYCIAQNERGRVDTVYRDFYMTAGQIYARWTDTCSRQIKDWVERSSTIDKKVRVVHVVEPRSKRDVTKADNKNMAWRSVYFEKESRDADNPDAFLSESGYAEFPYVCPRWEVLETDEYGDGPGHEVLPDAKELQEIEKSSVAAMHKMLDPPMKAPASMKNKFRMQPGSVNFYNVNDTSEIAPLYQINFDIAAAESKAQQIVYDIKEAFFNDLFMMIANMEGTQPLTATEVLERREEKMTVVGPVIERNIREFVEPALIRIYNIADNAGLIRPIPPELDGVPLKIDVVSILARAQKLLEVQPIQATVNFALGLSEIKPDIVDKVDLDQAVDEYADRVNAPAKIIRADDRVSELRQARAEEQRKQEETAQLMAAAQGAKVASETDTGGKNLLTDVAGAA